MAYRRQTKQIRAELDTHKLLKLGAIQENKVMSRFLDKVVKEYFERHGYPSQIVDKTHRDNS